MTHKLTEAFYVQAKHCADLGSPFMAHWCEMLASNLKPDTPIGKVLFTWQGDVAAGADNMPLRLMGALHNLVIQNKCPQLCAVYPPHYEGKTDAELWDAVQTAFSDHTPQILHQLKSPPQTNEVRRSGILLPGFLTIAEQVGNLPFVLSELGASAGLNLNWQHYHYEFGGCAWGDENSPVKLKPKWDGPVPSLANIQVQERRGCDLNPANLDDLDEITNLLSYLWADQPERITRTKHAFDMATKHPYHVDKMDAIDWLKKRLTAPHKDAVHVIYHTIAWQYFPDTLKKQGKVLIQEAGAKATKEAPLAWLGFEADGQAPGGALTLTIWPGGETKILARADYHGRWVNWY